MKLAHFAEILTDMAKNHPDAEVVVSYPARHAGHPVTRRGNITGYRTTLSGHPVIPVTLWVEVEHARSVNADD